MQSAECRIAPHGALTVTVFPPPCVGVTVGTRLFCALELLRTLAPLKGELDFAKQKTEGSIFFTCTSYLPFTRPALVPLWLPLRRLRRHLPFQGRLGTVAPAEHCDCQRGGNKLTVTELSGAISHCAFRIAHYKKHPEGCFLISVVAH